MNARGFQIPGGQGREADRRSVAAPLEGPPVIARAVALDRHYTTLVTGSLNDYLKGLINEANVGGLQGLAANRQWKNGRTGRGLGSTTEYLWQMQTKCHFASGDCYKLIPKCSCSGDRR
jgi:hypothetical protein